MKVAELVEQLQAMPQDAEVIVADDITVIDSVETECCDIDRVCRDTWTLPGDDREHSLVIIAAFPDDDEEDRDEFGLMRTEANAKRLWRRYVRSHGLPPGLTAHPDKVYADQGWPGWCAFTDAILDDGEAVDADPDDIAS